MRRVGLAQDRSGRHAFRTLNSNMRTGIGTGRSTVLGLACVQYRPVRSTGTRT
jgi:hypothetical protein